MVAARGARGGTTPRTQRIPPCLGPVDIAFVVDRRRTDHEGQRWSRHIHDRVSRAFTETAELSRSDRETFTRHFDEQLAGQNDEYLVPVVADMEPGILPCLVGPSRSNSKVFGRCGRRLRAF